MLNKNWTTKFIYHTQLKHIIWLRGDNPTGKINIIWLRGDNPSTQQKQKYDWGEITFSFTIIGDYLLFLPIKLTGKIITMDKTVIMAV